MFRNCLLLSRLLFLLLAVPQAYASHYLVARTNAIRIAVADIANKGKELAVCVELDADSLRIRKFVIIRQGHHTHIPAEDFEGLSSPQLSSLEVWYDGADPMEFYVRLTSGTDGEAEGSKAHLFQFKGHEYLGRNVFD